MNRKTPNILLTFLLALAIAMPFLTATRNVSAQLTGAIFTTLGDGTHVNHNIFDKCDEVYLNGGPQNENGAGLPVGTYYFQVTTPAGDLLSTDNAECRQVIVTENSNGKGVISGATGPACKHADGVFNPANGSTPVQLFPFSATPNPGGEYKVWLIAQTANTSIDQDDPKVIHFNNSDTKTDNFKCREQPGEPRQWS
jgi:hypothetical protein